MRNTLHDFRRNLSFGWTLPLLLLALVVLSGCEDESLMPSEADADPLFNRYVALGNSITAGFQSSGINAETQQESYAALVAEQMGTEFNIPRLDFPGCPPPLANTFTGERIGPPGVECALREEPIPSHLNNVAVPGSRVLDLITNFGENTSANALTTVLLGGRTQLQAAADADPTFVSVWSGNNDVLNAALVGNPALSTPPSNFEAQYTDVMDSLDALDIEGGILIGVANVTLIPYLSPGAAYWQAEQQNALPPTFDVDDNCAPAELGGVGDQMLVPFRYGFEALLSLAQAGQQVTLDCQDNRTLSERFGEALPPQLEDLAGYSILTGEEIQALAGNVQAYNSTIQSLAAERDWAYLDPNPLFAIEEVRAAIPLFPDIESVEEPFGPYFSKDGVHPSGRGHLLIAAAVIDAINASYGTDIPPLDVETTPPGS